MTPYRKLHNYKYQLLADHTHQLPPIFIGHEAENAYVKLKCCKLTLKKDYAWDGASGGAVDTPSFMRGSLIHDGLYQLIAEGLLSKSMRIFADRELKMICLQDGMSRIRAEYVYVAVRWFGGAHVAQRKISKDQVYHL